VATASLLAASAPAGEGKRSRVTFPANGMQNPGRPWELCRPCHWAMKVSGVETISNLS